MNKVKLLFASLLITSFSLISQTKNPFEGSITYSIAIEGDNMPKEILQMFSGSEAKTFIKGDKRRIEMNMAMQSTTSIIDSKKNTSITLMDFMGQKYLIRSTPEDMKKEEDAMPDYKINYTSETKEIAGYKCKKAEVTVKLQSGKDETFNVFVTDEIPYSEIKNTYKGLKGFPLEYSMSQSGLKMTFSAKKVSKDNVSDTKFDVPTDGYKEFNVEDFKKEMMKFGGQ